MKNGNSQIISNAESLLKLGVEHIQFANFVTSIGMAAFAPFLYELVCIRREKLMCIAGFALMYVFSYVCAKTDSIFLLALCSLLTGLQAEAAYSQLPSVILTYSILLVFSVFAPYYNPFSSIMQENVTHRVPAARFRVSNFSIFS